MRRLKKNKKGFTLVEVIVVLVIIGIMMVLAVPAVMKYINQAADTKVESQVRAGYIAAQTVVTSKVGDNPAITDALLVDEVTGAKGIKNVNDELGLTYVSGGKDNDADAVSSITCTVTKKKIDSCDIKIGTGTEEWTATRTEIKKK